MRAMRATMKEDFDNAYRDLGAAGVSEKCRHKAIKKAYNYFYNEEGEI
jgi:hypothetical protein